MLCICIHIYIYIYTHIIHSVRQSSRAHPCFGGSKNNANAIQHKQTLLLFFPSGSSFPRYCRGCRTDLCLAQPLSTQSMGTRLASPQNKNHDKCKTLKVSKW